MKSGFHWRFPSAGLLVTAAAVLCYRGIAKMPPPASPAVNLLSVDSKADHSLRNRGGTALNDHHHQGSAKLTESDRLDLIQRIALDPKSRPLFDRLLSDSFEQNPQAVLPIWDALPEDADRSAWFLPIAKGWSRRDPTEAASWLGDQPPSEARDRALLLATAAAAEAGDTAMALQQLRSLDAASPDRQALATQVLSDALRANPASAMHWRSRMPVTDPAYLPAVRTAADAIARENMQTAVDMIHAAMEPGPARDLLLTETVIRSE